MAVLDHNHVMTIRLVVVLSKNQNVQHSCILTLPFDAFSDEQIYLEHLVVFKNALLARFSPEFIKAVNDLSNRDALVETYASLGCLEDACLKVLKVSITYAPTLFGVDLLYQVSEFRESLLHILQEDHAQVTPETREQLQDLYSATTTPSLLLAYLIADGVLYAIMQDYYDYLASLDNPSTLSVDDKYLQFLPNRGLPS